MYFGYCAFRAFVFRRMDTISTDCESICEGDSISKYFSYNNKSKELISVPTLPGNGRMGFGLAATDDDKIIGVGGHNFDYESMSNVTMLDTQAEKFEWQNLPDMPSKVLCSRKEISQ